MGNLNDFATKRTDRIKEALDIYHALGKFDLKNSLSDDTFNASIRFNKQYFCEHIDALISSMPSENKTFDRENYTVSIHINQTNILVISMMTMEYYYLTSSEENDNQKLGQSTII
jgi:hypothetical protein